MFLYVIAFDDLESWHKEYQKLKKISPLKTWFRKQLWGSHFDTVPSHVLSPFAESLDWGPFPSVLPPKSYEGKT